MYSIQPILLLVSLVSMTSCTWVPVFQRQAQLVPAKTIDGEPAAAPDEVQSTIKEILNAVAKRHGLEACPSLLHPKRELGRFCSPGEGILYTLIVSATRINGTFRIQLEDADRNAFWKAKESDRARRIWSDLYLQLNAVFPGRISETTKP